MCCALRCAVQGVAGRAPPDPIEMSRLEQQAEAFEDMLKKDPSDMQVLWRGGGGGGDE